MITSQHDEQTMVHTHAQKKKKNTQDTPKSKRSSQSQKLDKAMQQVSGMSHACNIY